MKVIATIDPYDFQKMSEKQQRTVDAWLKTNDLEGDVSLVEIMDNGETWVTRYHLDDHGHQVVGSSNPSTYRAKAPTQLQLEELREDSARKRRAP